MEFLPTYFSVPDAELNPGAGVSGRGAQQLQHAGHTVQPGLPYSWGGGGQVDISGHVSWGRGWGDNAGSPLMEKLDQSSLHP